MRSSRFPLFIGFSTSWLRKVVIDDLQKSPGLLLPSSVVPPADIGVVEVSYEDQGL